MGRRRRIALADEGGSGSRGSHWESVHFHEAAINAQVQLRLAEERHRGLAVAQLRRGARRVEEVDLHRLSGLAEATGGTRRG